LGTILPTEFVRAVAPAAEGSAVLDARKISRPAAAQTPEAFVKFEAMVLQTFMQSILPGDTETVYGGGMAGDMWKSMLAQQIGEVMARRGGIGIADRVIGDHYLDGDRKAPVSGVSQGPAKEEADRQDLLSTALVEKMQRNIVKSFSEDLGAGAAGRQLSSSQREPG
jgi:flagellar protein FlgJ